MGGLGRTPARTKAEPLFRRAIAKAGRRETTNAKSIVLFRWRMGLMTTMGPNRFREYSDAQAFRDSKAPAEARAI